MSDDTVDVVFEVLPPMTTMEDIQDQEQPGPTIPEFYMMYYTVYDDETGFIRYRGNCSNLEFPIYQSRSPTIEGYYDGAEFYIDVSKTPLEVKPRPVIGAMLSKDTAKADGNDIVKIVGVPENTTVTVAGPVMMEGITTGEDVELAFSLEGKYTVTLDNFPFISERFDVNAT